MCRTIASPFPRFGDAGGIWLATVTFCHCGLMAKPTDFVNFKSAPGEGFVAQLAIQWTGPLPGPFKRQRKGPWRMMRSGSWRGILASTATRSADTFRRKQQPPDFLPRCGRVLRTPGM